MAMGVRFVCGHCGNAIQSWDEGNPYYIDQEGKKRFAYHPQRERDLCTAVESPHICLNCGSEFAVDSAAPITKCPDCDSPEIADTFDLSGRVCPACRLGVFETDPNFYAIS